MCAAQVNLDLSDMLLPNKQSALSPAWRRANQQLRTEPALFQRQRQISNSRKRFPGVLGTLELTTTNQSGVSQIFNTTNAGSDGNFDYSTNKM